MAGTRGPTDKNNATKISNFIWEYNFIRQDYRNYDLIEFRLFETENGPVI